MAAVSKLGLSPFESSGALTINRREAPHKAFSGLRLHESKSIQWKSVKITKPTCLYALKEMDDSGDTLTRPCNIVTSYEDILFAIHVVMQFIGTGMVGGKYEAMSEKKGYFGKPNNAASKADAASLHGDSDVHGQSESSLRLNYDTEKARLSTYGVINIDCMQFILVDHVLGLHHPLVRTV